MHQTKVRYQSSDGLADDVYRYLICCKRCMHFTSMPRTRGRGMCEHHQRVVAKQTLSCSAFEATEDGDNEIFLESLVRDGELLKFEKDGVVYYTDDGDLRDVVDQKT